MRDEYIAIIVEGRSREPQIIENLKSVFFEKKNIKIISFPAEQNIYMLWKTLKEDDFETDVIEVLREYSKDAAEILEGLTRQQFSEVYMFFDYDGHQNNLDSETDGNKVLLEMIKTFDNETEQGKLYISYPMVEALRDYWPDCCEAQTQCFWNLENLDLYKNATGYHNLHAQFKKYDINDWKQIINSYVIRISCLYQKEEVMTYEKYCNDISVLSIFVKELQYIKNGYIFVLSAFPQFLLDYNRKPFWKTCIKMIKVPACSKWVEQVEL